MSSHRRYGWLLLFTAMGVASLLFPRPYLFADDPGNSAPTNNQPSTWDQLKMEGRITSRYLQTERPSRGIGHSSRSPSELPQPNLDEYESSIAPILHSHCLECHGPDESEGNFRLDVLDPNLHTGNDVERWAEVFAAVTKGEMPPADSPFLAGEERSVLVQWLSSELHTASQVRSKSTTESGFRRMTRYEYNYALQDLLGVELDFARDLPPEPKSTLGFNNTAEHLSMSVTQLEMFHRLARQALARVIFRGPKPPVVSWAITMQDVSRLEWPKQDAQVSKIKNDLKDDQDKLQNELERLQQSFLQPHAQTYFRNTSTGRTVKAHWEYDSAKYAIAPVKELAQPPQVVDEVAILPAGQWLNIELGNSLPDEGILRVRVRASRTTKPSSHPPSLQLYFGWQASNEGRARLRVSRADTQVTALPDAPEFYQWDVMLGDIYPRNSVRKTSPMGVTPSPSEYIRLVNSSASPGDIQIDYVEVQAPVYDQWPTAAHQRILPPNNNAQDETAYAREAIAKFMWRAWRRPIKTEELDQKLSLFQRLQPECESFEEAIVETLAAVLSSPNFLYLARSSNEPSSPASEEAIAIVADARRTLSSYELATRLAMFLWCSVPDDTLLDLAKNGRLHDTAVIAAEVERMLLDPRSRRMTEQFVYQWLDLELLDFLNFQQHQPGFDPLLKEAMQYEPIALFNEVLQKNESLLNFVHADYIMVNERLAKHYGIEGVYGNQFRRVDLAPSSRRGGLLTQAGLLAMNSDFPDSHPLKRGKWILVSLLNDPPPPPPPAVPQIDLTNPEIAKMTLKERIEDHRNQPACYACHLKIDPWGIAFENYDAMGKWRDAIGDRPVDASSELSNHQRLEGMDGLKGYMLRDRQDQFVNAVVHKLTTFALGRSLKFADQAALDEIAESVRRQDDGLRSLILAIASSELFQTK